MLEKVLNRYILWIITAVCLLCASNVKWGSNRWTGIIAFDGKGYYAYLPAVFIYHDLHFKFHETEKKYSGKNNLYDYRVISADGTTDKYFAGTAITQLPFFLIAHTITKIIGGSADGYSFYYQVFISLAGIFYGIIGLYFLKKLLQLYLIPDNIITLTLISIFFGTHLFNYVVFDPSYSHTYSFGLISAFLLITKKYLMSPGRTNLILLGVLLGLICLARPVNVLIVLVIPFICGGKQNFIAYINEIARKNSGIIFSFLIFLSIISVQFIIYFLQTGKFFADTYVVEHFIWSRPEIINILFSYKKGLFVYTPVVLISMAGLIPIYRKNIFTFWSFILFFLTITYVFSCWWNWWYGGSFSSRPYVEFLSVFALLLATLFIELKESLLKISVYSLLVFCIILCQVQTYQYRYFVIHWEKMDKEHYWRVFMRIDQVIKQENANRDLLQ